MVFSAHLINNHYMVYHLSSNNVEIFVNTFLDFRKVYQIFVTNFRDRHISPYAYFYHTRNLGALRAPLEVIIFILKMNNMYDQYF